VADLDLIALLQQLDWKDMAPVEQGAIGGAEVFDIPQATNGLETSVLARSEVVVDGEATLTADGEVGTEGMALASELEDQGRAIGWRLRYGAADFPGDGGHGCSPRFPVLLSDVFPRREGCWKGSTVGFVGSLREAINEAGHRSIMSSSAASQQGMIIRVGDGGTY
jgi:hypothetical protein